MPAGSVELNGPVIGVLNQGGAFTVVDLDLASANVTGAAKFDEEPVGIIADPFGNRFLIILPETGEVRAVSSFGGAETLAAGIIGLRGGHPAPGGGVWILADGTATLRRDGAVVASHRATVFRGASEILAESADASVALVSDATVTLVDAATGSVLASAPASGAVDAVPVAGATGPAGFAVLDPAGVRIHYLDAPGQPVSISLAAEATRIVADPSGRYMFGHAPAGGRSRSSTSRAATSRRTRGFPDAGRSVACRRHRPLDDPPWRPRPSARHRPRGRFQAIGGRLLVPLPPLDRMLAVHRESLTGFVLDDSSAMGDAPPDDGDPPSRRRSDRRRRD